MRDEGNARVAGRAGNCRGSLRSQGALFSSSGEESPVKRGAPHIRTVRAPLLHCPPGRTTLHPMELPAWILAVPLNFTQIRLYARPGLQATLERVAQHSGH